MSLLQQNFSGNLATFCSYLSQLTSFCQILFGSSYKTSFIKFTCILHHLACTLRAHNVTRSHLPHSSVEYRTVNAVVVGSNLFQGSIVTFGSVCRFEDHSCLQVHCTRKILLKLINYSCSSYPIGASYSGQVDGFRNPMKNELKTRPCLKTRV